jgi:glutamate racemase
MTIDESFMTKSDDRPIGLFDSGIGGLTVLKSLLMHFPQESFIYLGDTARLPYGSKSPTTIERYLRQNIRFLNEQNVKAVVVACNSASTVLLEGEPEFAVPVYNVIEPGAATALKASQGKRIGVLGTKATVNAKAYVRSIHRLDHTATVFQQACPLLVPLVEEGWEDDPLTNLVIYRYVTPILQAGIDTLILGCTHYPALRAGIARVTGPGVALIDSAEAIAHAIRRDIESEKLGAGSTRALLRLMTTDTSPSFAEVASRLMHPHEIPELECVDIGTI